jgi:hypothetical protein
MLCSGGPLEAKYFKKNGGNLGGNGNSMLFKGARWIRHVGLSLACCFVYTMAFLTVLMVLLCILLSNHQTKLANSCFPAALASNQDATGITNVKAVCAAPGFAQTNLQVTAVSMGGMPSMCPMHFAQKAEDGTLPLLAAMFGPETKNCDFLEPERYEMYDKAIHVKFINYSADPEQQTMLWEKSEEACGTFSL